MIGRGVNILMPWNLRIGDYVAIGREVEIYNYGVVAIGDLSVVSQYSFVCTGSHDYTHPHMPLIWRSITIGSECWLAAGVFVAPGVTIGNGVVVAAKSVVVRDLDVWAVYGGNPAVRIKERVIRDISELDLTIAEGVIPK